MFQTLRNFHGQAFTVQYATTFAVVLAVVLAMMTYFKRIVQSRIEGLRGYSSEKIGAVFSNATYNLANNFVLQYEPYYHESEAETIHRGSVIDRIEGASTTVGIHSKEYVDYRTEIKSNSNQLPPKDAD